MTHATEQEQGNTRLSVERNKERDYNNEIRRNENVCCYERDIETEDEDEKKKNDKIK